MSNNCRFALDEKRYVIDASIPLTLGRATAMKAIPKTTGICASAYLWSVLARWSKKLIINLRPMEKLPWGEEEYEPRNEEAN